MKLTPRVDHRFISNWFILKNPLVILRIWSGLCFLLTSTDKFSVERGISPFLMAFFGQAGFTFPSVSFWITLSVSTDIVVGLGLIVGICIRWLSLFGAAELICAIYALIVNNGFIWSWSEGGIEYPLFWTMICFCIAIDAWGKFFCKAQTT